jgi:hydrogenase-4 membrane subunit HyfE
MPALVEETIKRMRSKIQLRSFLRAIFLYRKANNSPDKAAKPVTYLPASTAPIAPEVVFVVALAAVELAVLLEDEVTEAVVFAALVLEETAEVVTVVVLLAGLVVY